MLPGPRGLLISVMLGFFVPLAGAGSLEEAQSHAKQGIALAQAHNWAGAEHELQLATQAAPNVALYHAQLGSVLGLEGKWKESLASLQSAVRLEPASINYRREAAAVQWQLGLVDGAEKNLSYVLAKAPGDAGATLLLGLVSDARGDYEKAVGLLNSQYELAAAEPERALILCHASYASHPPADAGRLIETFKLHTDDPAWGNAIARCTEFAATAGSLPDAESLFALIPENATGRHTAGLQLAGLELEMGKTNDAGVLANRAVADSPTDAKAWVLKGDVELRTNAYKDALESYSHASKLDSSNADAVLDIAGVHFLAGDTDAAIAEYKSGIHQFPKDARFYVACAETLLGAPEPGESQAYAESLLKQAVALDPGSAEAHYQLGQLALQQGRLSSAESELSTSLRSGPDRSKVHFALSVVYRRMGQPEQAAKQFAIYQQLKVLEDGGSKPAPASKP
jgi:Flp pilus assembly protein TadD